MRVKNGKNKDLKQGKVDCRIQILQLARSSSKKKQKQRWIEKDGSTTAIGLKIRLEKSRNVLG